MHRFKDLETAKRFATRGKEKGTIFHDEDGKGYIVAFGSEAAGLARDGHEEVHLEAKTRADRIALAAVERVMMGNGLMQKARQIETKDFNDGKRWTALKAGGQVVRCWSQDAAETVIGQGKSDATISYHDNYAQAEVNGEVIGLAWEQS